MNLRTLIAIIPLLMLLVHGSDAKPTPLATGPAVVVDSSGAEIGPYFPPVNLDTGSPYVGSFQEAALRKIIGVWLTLPVEATGFLNTGGSLYYTSGDCSGAAYLLYQNTLLLADTNVSVLNGVLYYANPATVQAATTNSFRLVSPDGTLQPCSQSVRVDHFGPAISFDLSTLGFTPPFTIQLK